MQNENQVIDLQNYIAAESQAPADVSPQHLPAGTPLLVGQYRITGYLNCGGFGITYRARDSLKREVVIKECFPGEMAYRDGKAMGARSPKYKDELRAIVQHFVKEAHRQAIVQHKNVVHVHQIFEENDTAYIAMDFVDGLDLLDIMEHDPSLLGPVQVERLVRRMLEAIDFVHGLGLLHRDISPDNILIDRSGEPVLIDFGSAHEHVATRHLSRLKFVKDGYSPQEFYISGSEQGPWSDLYSFAASMYHVITGVPPAESQRRLAAMAAKQPDPYVPLVGQVDGYAPHFLDAIDKALRTLPKDRLQSAKAWLDLLDAEPVAVAVAAPPKPEVVRFGDAVAAIKTRLPAIDWPIAVSPALAAGLCAGVLIGGVGLYALLSGGAPEAPTMTMDSVAQAVQEVREPTPPVIAAAPIQQVLPDIGDTPELTAPSLAFRQPPLPSGLQPIGRTQSALGLTAVEQVSAPRISVISPSFGPENAASADVDPGALSTPLTRVITSVTASSLLPEAAAPEGADLALPSSVELPALGIDISGFEAPEPGERLGMAIDYPGGVVRGIVPQNLPGYWLDLPPEVERTKIKPRVLRLR